MSLKKFYGANSREAMIEARRALGEDAVVISTRRTDRGVEVVAASQTALASMTEAESFPAASPTHVPAPEPRRSFADRVDAQRQSVIRGETQREPTRSMAAPGPVPFLQFIQEQPRAAAPIDRAPVPARPAQKGHGVPTYAQATTPVAEPPLMLGQSTGAGMDQMMSELRAEFSQIREWMTGQFDTMAFQDASRRKPIAAAIQKELLQCGFSPRLARDLAMRLPDGMDTQQARGWAAAVLEKNLGCVRSDQDLIDTGGIYALVGPTGVGKTTTVAKLASRCAVKYGRESVGLVTIDSYRIGAQDQLRIYGKILGITVHTAQDRETLLGVLRSLTGKRLVLIDTVGLGQRDERVQELLTTVGSNLIKRLLVVNAAAQAETLEDVVIGYRGAQPNGFTGAVLSKTDEAVRLGSALDVMIRNRLPLYYETNGQRVPEDIAMANPKSLILRAVTHLPARAFQVPMDEVALTFFARQAAAGVGAAHA